jgi:hypothetical protein
LKALLDENLSPHIAAALNALVTPDNHSVQSVNGMGLRGTPDLDLFKKMHAAGVTVHITLDHHNRVPAERAAIAALGMVVFVLEKSWANQTYWLQAERLVRWIPAIFDQAARMNPPAIFSVPFHFSGNGKFKQIRL